MKTTPHPFQSEDVDHIWGRWDGRGLLSWEMGLGKTYGALLGAKRYLPLDARIAVVCPKTVKEVWRQEALKHFGMRAEVLSGRATSCSSFGLKPRLTVINYDVLGVPLGQNNTWTEYLRSLKLDLLIFDEIQYIKSETAKRSKACEALAEGVPHIIGLSGTPMLNRPIELWFMLKIIKRDLFPNRRLFGLKFCDAKLERWGYSFNGATRTDELHRILTKNAMRRRLKIEVLSQLPPKTRSVIPMDISKKDRNEYDEAARTFIAWLAKISPSKAARALKAEAMVRLGYLKRLAGRFKIESVIEWITEFIEWTNEKLLVFGIHRSVLHELHDKFPNSVIIDGSVTGPHRDEAIARFNKQTKCRLMFSNMTAAGVGWSCTSASTVLFVEMGWTPGEHVQAEDRCHGISRGTGNPVNSYYAVTKDTIEEDLCKIIQKKQDVLASVLDGKSSGDLNVFDILTKKLTATYTPVSIVKRRK